jgi:hypothetical protein
MRLPSTLKTLSPIIMCCLLLCSSEFVFSARLFFNSIGEKNTPKILREIYLEMKDFDNYPGCDFIKREFFVGEDDDDTNKDIHVVILVQNVDEKEKITIQVTYMERRKGKPVVGIAKSVKIITYFFVRDQVKIIKSDFYDKEKEFVLPGVLQSIKNKKKLLKDI